MATQTHYLGRGDRVGHAIFSHKLAARPPCYTVLGIFYKYCCNPACSSCAGAGEADGSSHSRARGAACAHDTVCVGAQRRWRWCLCHTRSPHKRAKREATRKAGAMGVSSYSSLHHALALTLSLSVRAVHPSSQTCCSSIVPIPLLRFWVRPSICIARPCYRVAEWQRHPCNPRACGHLRHLCTVVALCPPRLPTQPAFQLALRPPHELAQSAPYCPVTASVPISTPA